MVDVVLLAVARWYRVVDLVMLVVTSWHRSSVDCSQVAPRG